MPTQILMPALSPTMEEGKLAKWLVKEGDAVKSGMVIAEIETDKATMEVEAVDEGKLGSILVPEGTENVKVNTPIALILQDGDSLVSPVPGSRRGLRDESTADFQSIATDAKPEPAKSPASPAQRPDGHAAAPIAITPPEADLPA